MTKIKELKNCPCCGGKAISTEVTLLFNSPGDVHEVIRCTNCGLSMEGHFGDAKDKWNARVENVTQLNSEDDSLSQALNSSPLAKAIAKTLSITNEALEYIIKEHKANDSSDT